MASLTGLTNANTALAGEDLEGNSFVVAGGKVGIKPLSPTAIAGSVVGVPVPPAGTPANAVLRADGSWATPVVVDELWKVTPGNVAGIAGKIHRNAPVGIGIIDPKATVHAVNSGTSVVVPIAGGGQIVSDASSARTYWEANGGPVGNRVFMHETTNGFTNESSVNDQASGFTYRDIRVVRHSNGFNGFGTPQNQNPNSRIDNWGSFALRNTGNLLQAASGFANDIPVTENQTNVYVGMTNGTATDVVTYTGFANGVEGRFLLLTNNSSAKVVLKHLSPASAATNQLNLASYANGRDCELLPNQTAIFVYDGTVKIWRAYSLPQPVVIDVQEGSSAAAANTALSVIGPVAVGGVIDRYFVTSSVQVTAPGVTITLPVIPNALVPKFYGISFDVKALGNWVGNVTVVGGTPTQTIDDLTSHVFAKTTATGNDSAPSRRFRFTGAKWLVI